MKVPHAVLLEALNYDPETGIWTWLKTSKHSKCCPGDVAGSITTGGYWRVQLYGTSYRSARLAWFYMTGEWPTHEVDHVDSDPSNDSWDNLESLDQVQNLRKRNFDIMRGISCQGRKFAVSICGEYHGLCDRIEVALAVRDFALWYNDLPIPQYEMTS